MDRMLVVRLVLALALGLGLATGLSDYARAQQPSDADADDEFAADGGAEGDGAARPDTGGNTGIDAPTDAEPLEVDTAIRDTINAAVKRLIMDQHPQDGYFPRLAGGGGGVRVAVTALAGLALISTGSTPRRGPYARNVLKALIWLLDQQDQYTGYISGGDGDGSRIHGHGYALLFLTQIHGMTRDHDLRDRVESAIRLGVSCTINAQTPELGGWGYEPTQLDFDEGSTTVTQIEALRAARDAGFSVDSEAIDTAVRYMRNTAARSSFRRDGANVTGYTFRYSLRGGYDRRSFALTAAGLTVLHSLGLHDDPITQGAMAWLEDACTQGFRSGSQWSRSTEAIRAMPTYDPASSWGGFFFYSHWYASQALHQAEDLDGYNRYFATVSKRLIDGAEPRDGGWRHDSYGAAYANAFGILILTVPDGYLPIHAR